MGRLRIFGVHGEQVARQPVEFLVRRVPLHGGDVAYGSLALVGRKRLLVARADNGIAECGDVGIAESVFRANTVTFRRRVSKVAKPSGAGKLVATRTVSSGLPATMSWSRASRHRQVC